MNLLLTTLLALPAANPAGPFDGAWQILSVQYNGKRMESHVKVTIRNSRLVLNEGKGEQPITIEFDANHRAWLWAGPSKTITRPAYDELVQKWDPKGTVTERITVPGRTISVAQRGFHLEGNDQLEVFFLPLEGNSGASLVLLLRREKGDGSAGSPPAR
jgi:hypothetical protein